MLRARRRRRRVIASASSTATSSPRTCWSPRSAARSCSTSAAQEQIVGGAIDARVVVVGLASDTLGTGAGITIVGLGSAGLGPSVLVLMGAIVPAERRGTGAGVLQLCADGGGMLGPLFGTALFAGATTTAYLVAGGIVAAFIPAALWLTRIEKTTTG